MQFGSVCSGIEAASVAFAPLGWRAAWLAEIEPFPCAVLAHHYPDVPNLGDMTAIARRVLTGEVSAPDVLCGGTPCQAFSVAGLRQSLADERGNLSLKFVELADAIDHVRVRRGEDECIVFWENVPGVLSTRDNAFGCFLGGLAGEDGPLEPPGGKWANAGAVYGPERAVAWRLFDAQFFGLAQRRRRVFVVASARKGFDPATVLFEFDGVRRDTAPSREARQTAPTIPARSTAGGGLGTDFDCDGGVIQVCPTLRAGGNRTGGDRPPGTDVDTADSLIPMAYGIRTANTSSNGWGIQEEVTHTLDCAQGVAVAHTTHALRGEGFDASEDGTVRGTPLVPAVAPALLAQGNQSGGDRPPGTTVDTCESLIPAIVGQAMSSKWAKGTAGPAGPAGDEHHNLIPVPFDTTQITSPSNYSAPKAGDPCHPLAARAHVPCVAYSTKLHNTTSNQAGKFYEGYTAGLDANSPPPAVVAFHGSQDPDVSGAVTHPVAAQTNGMATSALIGMQVRRLTPTEAERLMGFPDGYTAIPWRKKPARECPDGPRYKSLGNSWAVPVARWIGCRIDAAVRKQEP